MGVVVVTGHRGYLGSVLAPVLARDGHVVHGIDAGLTPCATVGPVSRPPMETTADIRDVGADLLDGADEVVHLAALSNDPLGEVDPDLTVEINAGAAVRLARLARERGVRRFVFASSCSLYGASDGTLLQEDSPLRPVSTYARAKAEAEAGVLALADGWFTPVALRLATLHGPSPALRTDLVLNRLTVIGHHRGRVTIDSDGASWRPLVHVEDAARIVASVLRAPTRRLAGRALNVVGPAGNVRMEDLARRVGALLPDAVTVLDPERPADPRSYRASGRRLAQTVRVGPTRSVEDGVLGVLDQMGRHRPRLDELLGPGHVRLSGLQQGLRTGRIGADLRAAAVRA